MTDIRKPGQILRHLSKNKDRDDFFVVFLKYKEELCRGPAASGLCFGCETGRTGLCVAFGGGRTVEIKDTFCVDHKDYVVEVDV